MKKIVFIIFFLIFISCHTSKPSTDADTVTTDSDIIAVGDDMVAIDDGSVVEDEIVSDDTIPVSDADTDDSDCPPLSTAPFPYYKEDGTIHFCRKCDTPAKADDPQCVRNLWEEAQKRYVAKYPDKDCYPYPCDMPNLKPMVNGDPIGRPISECDLALPPYGFNNGNPRWKHYGMVNGKIGFQIFTTLSSGSFIEYSNDSRGAIYDVLQKTYRFIMPGLSDSFAFNGKYSVIASFEGSKLTNIEDLENIKLYLLSYSADKGYELIYNKPLDYVYYAPLMNDRWIYVKVNEIGGSGQNLYAKIGEWKWHSFSNDLSYIASFSGDHLGFHSSDYTGYICDLSKWPSSSTECIKVGRPGELVFYVTMDQANEHRFAYTALTEGMTDHGLIVVGEIGNEEVSYTEHLIPFTEETTNMTGGVDHFVGNTILYSEKYQRTETDEDVKWCFYRLDKKKSYCSKLVVDTYDLHDQGKAEFEGEYVVWQSYAGYGFYLRDMDCYCEKEGVCPFEESRIKTHSKRP